MWGNTLTSSLWDCVGLLGWIFLAGVRNFVKATREFRDPWLEPRSRPRIAEFRLKTLVCKARQLRPNQVVSLIGNLHPRAEVLQVLPLTMALGQFLTKEMLEKIRMVMCGLHMGLKVMDGGMDGHGAVGVKDIGIGKKIRRTMKPPMSGRMMMGLFPRSCRRRSLGGCWCGDLLCRAVHAWLFRQQEATVCDCQMWREPCGSRKMSCCKWRDRRCHILESPTGLSGLRRMTHGDWWWLKWMSWMALVKSTSIG